MNPEIALTEFKTRLDRLDHRCKWLRREAWLWRIGLLCAILAVVALGIMNRHRFGIRPLDGTFVNVHTESFVLHDAVGTSRGIFGPDEQGNPSLTLYSANGKLRIVLASNDGGATGLALLDDKGAYRLRLRVNDQQEPSVELCDALKNVRILLTLTERGPQVEFRDDKGQLINVPFKP